MIRLAHIAVMLLIMGWLVGLFIFDVGVLVHVPFIMALCLLIFEVVRDEKK